MAEMQGSSSVVDEADPNLNAQASNSPYICDRCQKVFLVRSRFDKHLKIHEKKRFPCNVCEKSYSQKHYLTAHLYEHNTGEKFFYCDVCSLRFTHRITLATHKKTHTDIKPFVCNVCNKGFRLKNNMEEHLRTHTGEKPFNCEICHQSFTFQSQFKVHLQSHTGVKHTCLVCEKSFSRGYDLKLHSAIHKDEKDFECEECGGMFSTKKTLIKHKRRHTKPFSCDHCEKSFSENYLLKEHFVKAHKSVTSIDAMEDVEDSSLNQVGMA